MKFTFILTLAAALCAVAVHAEETLAPHANSLSNADTKTTPTLAASSSIDAIDKKKKKKPTKTKAPSKPTKIAAPKPKALDACGLMAKEAMGKTNQLSYASVKGCYEAQKFNPDVAAKTLSSIENALGNFYAFVDQAKEDSTNVPGSPFKTPTVDLMKELAKIRQKKDWKSDYEFQMALTYLLASANDGHLAYRNYCYRTAVFQQPISLYAPVVDGVQSVRVFFVDTTVSKKGLPKDATSLNDCTVVTIDGQPALQAVQEFTDRTSAISKDPGVRLNDALASTSWYQNWSSSPGGFASRWEVPKKDAMDYTLQCGTGSSAKTVKLTVPWSITPSDMFEYNLYTNVKGYWKIQCQAMDSSFNSVKRNKKSRSESGPVASAVLDQVKMPRRGDVRRGPFAQDGGDAAVAPATTVFRERGTITRPEGGHRDGRDAAAAIITRAKLVHETTTTVFYKLNGSKYADTCVAVIATEEATFHEDDSSDYTEFIKGFQKLQDQGCKKLILDMTNNGGGSVDFAYFVNQLFFPNAKPFFEQDLRASSLVQAAARQAIKKTSAHSTFDAKGYNSVATGKPFKDASMFLKGVNQKRGGSTVRFTQRSYFAYKWPFLPLKSKQLNFTPQNMAIVTNGFCGSACTMIATRFAEVHGVKTYAIGGIAKRPLSYFSFPGGFVLDNRAIVGDLDSIGLKKVKNMPTELPVLAATSLAVGEIYASSNSTIPLEYDAKLFPAKVHLDQDSVSARHPDQVWLKVADSFAASSKKKSAQ
ncbi:hypothetical protein EDD11_007468 [Mortierella claussenii]|nr:hypothetical protein EDD11_007468 [Mortierella claussenii]